MAGQLVEFDWNWEPWSFHCPACGAVMITAEGEFARNCDHLLFAYLGEVGEFEHATPEIASLVAKLEGEDGEEIVLPTDPEFIEKLSDNDVLFSMSSYEYSPGPVTTTVFVGVRFANPE